ncbi:hypothetical protein ERJ75_001701900 [Trypanosoma vivax]|nr:hypothetical protein ERJ75_001701900 [Trypanosoma vivax]
MLGTCAVHWTREQRGEREGKGTPFRIVSGIVRGEGEEKGEMMLAACAALLLLAAGGEAAVTKGGTSHAFGALCSLFFEAGDAAATIAHIGHEVGNVTAEALAVARDSTGRGRAWRGEEGKVLGTLLEGAKDEGFNKAIEQCAALKQQGPLCTLLLLAKNVTDSAARARSVAHTARFGQSCKIAASVPAGPDESTEAGECISKLLHKSEAVQKGSTKVPRARHWARTWHGSATTQQTQQQQRGAAGAQQAQRRARATQATQKTSRSKRDVVENAKQKRHSEREPTRRHERPTQQKLADHSRHLRKTRRTQAHSRAPHVKPKHSRED